MANELSCGVVIVSGDEFLVVKHNDIGGGHWDFPKGHKEEKETEKQTAIREAYEETGLKIRLFDNFRTEIFYYPKPGVLKTVVFFLGFPESKKFKPITGEIVEGKWLKFENALKQLTYENAKEVLRKAYAFLQNS